MKEIADKLKTVLNILGIDANDPSRTKPSRRTIVLLTLFAVFLVDSVFLLIYNWEKVDVKMNAFKNITSLWIVGSYTFVYVFFYKDFNLQISVIDEGISEFRYTSTARKNLLDSIGKDLSKQEATLFYTLTLYVLATGSFPLVAAVFKILTVDSYDDIAVENLLLNFSFYFPVGYRNMIAFVIVYFYEIIISIAYGLTGYLCYLASLISMQIVENELKLLCSSIKEIDAYVTDGPMTAEVNWETYLRCLVRSHQNIYRKAEWVNKGVQAIAFVLNSGVSAYLCTSLYFIVQNNSKLLFVVQEGLVCVVIAIVFQLFCSNGENITTESENVRRALYEQNWLDKPLPCKKALLIMMKRSGKPVEMRPFGLFVLNLRNFLKAMNAAYSYYNIVNNVSKNK